MSDQATTGRADQAIETAMSAEFDKAVADAKAVEGCHV